MKVALLRLTRSVCKKYASLVCKNTILACRYQLYKFRLSSGAPLALEAYYPANESNTLDLKEKIIIRVNMDLLFYHVLYPQRILA
jgi:hypothetical protein